MSKKTYEKEEMTSIWGKYVTEIDLRARGWSTEMISNSKSWAKANGVHRTSPIHGEDEWRLPLDEEFKNKEKKNEKYEAFYIFHGPGEELVPGGWTGLKKYFQQIYIYIYKYHISVYTSLHVLTDS